MSERRPIIRSVKKIGAVSSTKCKWSVKKINNGGRNVPALGAGNSKQSVDAIGNVPAQGAGTSVEKELIISESDISDEEELSFMAVHETVNNLLGRFDLAVELAVIHTSMGNGSLTTDVKSIIKHIHATKETFLEDVNEDSVKESLNKLKLASLMPYGT